MQKIATKKLLYIAGGVILLGVIAYSVSVNLKKSNQSGTGEVTSTTLPKSAPAGSVKSSKAPLSATKAYLDALKIYKTTGYYFQFVDCHGSPGSFTLKVGKKFMLDNRDGVAHKFRIQGGQSFNIGAYGFAIATAPSTVGDHYIDCDGGGAAKIIVQK